MIKGIIFDLDGTLLNTIEDIAIGVNAALKHEGFPIHETEEYFDFVGSGAKVLIHRALGKYDNDESFNKVMDYYLDYYGKHSTEHTEPYEGIIPMLETLHKKYKLAVVSNKPHKDTSALVPQYFGEELFDAVYGQREGVPRKPDPAVCLEIAKNWGLKPDEIAYIGDSENDVYTANNAGHIAICVLWGFRSEDFMRKTGKCNYFCKNAKDVIKTLEEINGLE